MIIAAVVPNKIHKTRNRLLSLFKLVGFFLAALLVVAKQGTYEAKQLVNCSKAAQVLAFLDDRFADSKSNLPFV